LPRISNSDLVGQRFGKGVVIEFRGRNRRLEALFVLQCDCGGEYVATRPNLKSGNTKSCGCLPKKTPEDLRGIPFHLLTPREMLAERDKDGKVLWFCDCECGGTAIVRANSLKQGAVKSCGCLHGRTPANHAGKSYNALTGERLLRKRDKHGRPLWVWKCRCGRKKVAAANAVTRGKIKSCKRCGQKWRREEAYVDVVLDENGVPYYTPSYMARVLGLALSTVHGFKEYCFWNSGKKLPTKELENGGLKRKFDHFHGPTVDSVKKAMAKLPYIPEIPDHKYIGHVAEALGLCLRTLRRRMAAAKAKAVKKPAKCKDGRGGRRTYVPNSFVEGANGDGATVADGHVTLTDVLAARSAEHRRNGPPAEPREPLQTQEQQPVFNTCDRKASDILNRIEQKLPDPQVFSELAEEIKLLRIDLKSNAGFANRELLDGLNRIDAAVRSVEAGSRELTLQPERKALAAGTKQAGEPLSNPVAQEHCKEWEFYPGGFSHNGCQHSLSGQGLKLFKAFVEAKHRILTHDQITAATEGEHRPYQAVAELNTHLKRIWPAINDNRVRPIHGEKAYRFYPPD
jgi:hypothetical protein